ncbi:protoporphyrinogen oxidase [Paenibacillus rubinfantis]|uniref:protoporphyrinogen oxidase n=1 Tax=Paenibacillus rubinfantis TaxID=1720296 RepID=UPI00073F4302|nr:protoporphyrinogen oxidase [Paenibacillus rubinfantis]
MRKTIAVVGGGITGLSAAYYARKWLRERRIDAEITIIEETNRLGGKIRTLHRDGFTIEQGPDSFIARKTAVLELIQELGLEQRLVGTNPRARKNFILHHGRFHPMPPGLMLGIPTQMWPMVKTGLLSPVGKLRAGLDLLLPAKRDEGDESLGGFIRRRLGREVLENLTEPLLAGIYAGDTAELSLKATFPQFMEMERKHRSLILGLLASKKQPPPKPREGVPKVAYSSMFLTLEGGLTVLTEALTAALQEERVITGQAVVGLTRQGHRYELELSGAEQVEADAVILATPANAAARLLQEQFDAAAHLEQIRYVSVANLALAYRREEIRHDLNGSGVLIPRGEGRMITAITWTSSKWLHSAPEDRVLLRTYIGRLGDQAWTQLPEAEVRRRVAAELKELMGIEAEPLFCEMSSLPESMPQYPVGHVERLQELRGELERTMPGVLLCGAGYGGVGIPDCIRQGKEAAEAMLTRLGDER